MSQQSNASFSTSIHGARGLFCMMVVIYHIWNSGLPRWPVPEVLNQFIESFRYGVELFFAISGYVIHVTMHPVSKGIKTPIQFILNRVTRIFPVLWVTTLIFLPLGIWKGEPQITEFIWPIWSFAITLIGNLLALGPIWPVPVFYGVTWSIGYEFVFYSLCFAHLASLRYFNRNLVRPIFIIGILIVAIHPRAIFFLSGLFVSQQHRYHRSRQNIRCFPFLWLVIFLFSWHWLAAESSPFFVNIFSWALSFHWPLGILSFVAMTGCIAGIVDGRGMFCKFLNSSALQWLGTISYSLYLWHLIILGIIKFALQKLGVVPWLGDWSQFILALFGLPLSIGVSYLSFVILEQQFTQRLRRFFGLYLRRRPNEIS